MHSIAIDFERIVQEIYEAILCPGDTAIDIGAHVGRHTLPLAHCVGPTGTVLAVEPLPACQDELLGRLCREHPDVRGAVRILPFALSDQPGSEMLLVAENHLPHSSLRSVPCPTPTPTRSIQVEVETLDRLGSELTALHYIKLDAEGAELHILRGGMACLERFRPVVGFEFGTDSNREFGVEPVDMARFWKEQAYVVYAITGACLNEADFVRRAQTREIWDYVAVPAENAVLNRRIRSVLNRPRVNWLEVRAQLNHALDHAEVGSAMPPLRRFRGPFWHAARGAAWLLLLAARIITIPQRLFNRALLLALERLLADLEARDRASQGHERQVEEMQLRLESLQSELRSLREESAENTACTLITDKR